MQNNSQRNSGDNMQLSRYVLSHKLDSGKDKELLDTIFEEVKTYWEKQEDASLQNSLPKCV